MKSYIAGFSDSSAFVKYIIGLNTTVTNSEDCLEPLNPLASSIMYIENPLVYIQEAVTSLEVKFTVSSISNITMLQFWDFI